MAIVNIVKADANSHCIQIKTNTMTMNFVALKDFYLIEKYLLKEKNCQFGRIKKNIDNNNLHLELNETCKIKPQNPNEVKKYSKKPGVIYLDPQGNIKIILEQQNELDYASEKNFIFGYLANSQQIIKNLKLKKTLHGQNFTISATECKNQ
jgi:hypothetical protein